MTGTVCNKSWVNILKSNGGANDIRYFIMNIFIYKYLLTCTCFEQLWSVGAAPPGDPEAPHTPGLPSVPRYQSFFRGTSDFPGSHSAWPQHSHLTFSVCWAGRVCSVSLQADNASMCQLSPLSPQLGQPRTTPDQSPGVSWGLRPQSAIGDPSPVSLASDQASVESV